MSAFRSSLVSMIVLGLVTTAAAKPQPAKTEAEPVKAEAEPAADEDAVGEPGQDRELSDEELAAGMRGFEESLAFRTGTIELPCGKATLALPDGYRYLGPDDADRVLQAWGNPARPDTQGMLVPPAGGLFDDHSWAVVITYSGDGHVDDADAASIDYDALLQSMRADTRKENLERKRLELSTVELVGWAEPPHYDRATRKLYWAQELAFEDNDATTVNYAVRVLGREGVLELNAIAAMAELPAVKPDMAKILGFSEFTAGNRYTDYRKGTDRDSGYGIAALVAGGAVAAKVVGSKGFWAILLAAKKLIILIAVAIGGFFKSIWSRLRGRRDGEA